MRILAVLLAALMPFGGVYVTSLPSGADVWIDGSYIGRTPVLVDGLKTGRHAITITRSGWKVAEVDQDVAAGNTVATNVMLVPLNPPMARGNVQLHGLQPSAKVSFDHQAWLTLQPRYAVTIGEHHLSIREPRSKFERDITVYPDQTTNVLFRAPTLETRSAVVAALSNYVPASAARVAGERIVIHWGGHTVLGQLGDSKFVVDGRNVVYDAPAGMVSGRLYLPLDLILTITGGKDK